MSSLMLSSSTGSLFVGSGGVGSSSGLGVVGNNWDGSGGII